MLNLSRLSTTLSKDEMTSEIRLILHGKGYDSATIKNGFFSSVIILQDCVVKISPNDDYSNLYYDLCARVHSIHAPKVYVYQTFEHTRVYIMEKLHENANFEEYQSITQYATTGMEKWNDDAKYNEKVPKMLKLWCETVALERLRIHIEDNIDMTWDAHHANWMHRENGTLVLTDPWS